MTSKTLLSKRHGFINQFLPVYVFIAFSFLNLSPKTQLVEPALAQEHPFLLVKESEYAEMRTRALTSPGSTMKTKAISDFNNTTYLTSDTYNTKINKLNIIVSSGALAYILDPANKTAYKNKLRDTLLQWDNLWASRTGAGWSICVAPGSAFFNSVLALDIIYNDLTSEERTNIENKLAVAGDWWWNAMTPLPPAKPQSWGAMVGDARGYGHYIKIILLEYLLARQAILIGLKNYPVRWHIYVGAELCRRKIC